MRVPVAAVILVSGRGQIVTAWSDVHAISLDWQTVRTASLILDPLLVIAVFTYLFGVPYRQDDRCRGFVDRNLVLLVLAFVLTLGIAVLAGGSDLFA
jgi:hypothetical protein